jgi:hypothetical protein
MNDIRITLLPSLQSDLQPVLVLDLQQRLRVVACIVHGVVGVLRLPQMLEAGKHILDYPFVERTQVGRAMAERVLAQEMVEVPVDELPIEAVVVGNEHGLAFGDGTNPVGKLLHHRLRVIKRQCLVTRETADLKGLGNGRHREVTRRPPKLVS